MPLVTKQWANHGLRSWDVVEMGEDSLYLFQCIMYWDSIASFEEAGAKHGDEIFADIQNYTNSKPITTKGEVKGQWKA